MHFCHSNMHLVIMHYWFLFTASLQFAIRVLIYLEYVCWLVDEVGFLGWEWVILIPGWFSELVHNYSVVCRCVVNEWREEGRFVFWVEYCWWVANRGLSWVFCGCRVGHWLWCGEWIEFGFRIVRIVFGTHMPSAFLLVLPAYTCRLVGVRLPLQFGLRRVSSASWFPWDIVDVARRSGVSTVLAAVWIPWTSVVTPCTFPAFLPSRE